jgi:hypothetical protein
VPGDSRLLETTLPAFARELRRLLEQEDRHDLAGQIADLRLVDRCRCGEYFCATFYTVPKPRGAWGPDHETIVLESAESGMINIDLVAGRIVEVEVLDRDDVRAALDSLFA